MKIVLILFLFISSMGLCQFSLIWSIPDNFSGFEVKGFEMNDSGHVLLISRQYDGGPTSNLMAYSSADFGSTWDSTLIVDQAMMKDNAFITEGGKLYFSTVQNVFPTQSTPGYQRKVFHSSLDGGTTWSEKTIDSLEVGSNFSRSLAFLNDSTGMYFYGAGKYLTTDYGQSWQKISTNGAEHLGILDDRFIFYWYQSAMTINPLTNQIDSFEYIPFCEGNVDQSYFKDTISYRMIFASDGEDWGSAYNHNYASLNVDELPLGDQRIIHFPQHAALIDIEVPQSCIHLVLHGRYARSCDGGDTFYFVDAFNGNTSDEIIYADFISDTIGLLVTKNNITGEWNVWETTNGGGQNLEQVLTNQSMASLDNVEDEIVLKVYPNPASDQLRVEANETILTMELYSMDGKLVLSKDVGSKAGEFLISPLSKGTYVVKVFTSSAVGVLKVIRE